MKIATTIAALALLITLSGCFIPAADRSHRNVRRQHGSRDPNGRLCSHYDSKGRRFKVC